MGGDGYVERKHSATDINVNSDSSSLEINAKAKEIFNTEASDVLKDIEEYSGVDKHGQKPEFQPEIVAQTIEGDDIQGEMIIANANEKGEVVSKFFTSEGKTYLLNETGYSKIKALARRLLQQKGFRENISIETLCEIIFDWVTISFLKKISISFCDYLFQHCETRISAQKILIPILNLCIQTKFKMGNVEFTPITARIYNTWIEESILRNKKPEDEAKIIEFFELYRKRIQGFAAASMHLIGDPKVVEEKAIESTVDALSALKFFHPSAIQPTVICCADQWGEAFIPSRRYISWNAANDFTMHSATCFSGKSLWSLSNTALKIANEGGLGKVSQILEKPKRSQLDQRLINALRLYAKAASSFDVDTKTVFILTSLESLLLKNTSESILQNIAERLAIMNGKDLKDKRRIIKLTKDIYGLRSAFVHHAKSISNTELLSEFMWISWMAVQQIIAQSHKWRTHSDMIDSIDDIKFS